MALLKFFNCSRVTASNPSDCGTQSILCNFLPSATVRFFSISVIAPVIRAGGVGFGAGFSPPGCCDPDPDFPLIASDGTLESPIRRRGAGPSTTAGGGSVSGKLALQVFGLFASGSLVM